MTYILEHFISVGSFVLAFVLLTDVFRKHRQPGGTMAWALAIVLIPYVGVPLYLLFGGRKIAQVRKAKADLRDLDLVPSDEAMVPRNLADRALRTSNMPPPREGNRVELAFSGEDAFHRLLALIESATTTVHVTTFILGKDEVGRQIVAALARKAEQGVQVRLLLDSLGSFWTQRRFVAPLLEAGGTVGHFMPVLPLRRRWSANLRNHRKLVVVDNTSAMVGGMNLSTLFMGPTPNPDRFIDASVFLQGPAVEDVQEIFLNDWQYATGEDQDQIAAQLKPADEGGPGIIQVTASGPDVPDDIMHDALVCAIMAATERIWVVTPYLVPDEALLRSLCLQARMGRDVRLVLPLKSNHRIPDWARRPALRRLHEAGAKIYTLPKGMIHAKLVLFDSNLAVSGSPNLDMRSMYLNFEIALFHYSSADIEAIDRWVTSLTEQCDAWKPRTASLLDDWGEGLARLVSPLL